MDLVERVAQPCYGDRMSLTKEQNAFVQYVLCAGSEKCMSGENLRVSERAVRDAFPEPPKMVADIRALAGLPDVPNTLEQFRDAIRQEMPDLDVQYDFLDASFIVG